MKFKRITSAIFALFLALGGFCSPPLTSSAATYNPSQWTFVKAIKSNESYTLTSGGLYNIIVVGGVGGNSDKSGNVTVSTLEFKPGDILNVTLSGESTTISSKYPTMRAYRSGTSLATTGNLFNLESAKGEQIIGNPLLDKYNNNISNGTEVYHAATEQLCNKCNNPRGAHLYDYHESDINDSYSYFYMPNKGICFVPDYIPNDFKNVWNPYYDKYFNFTPSYYTYTPPTVNTYGISGVAHANDSTKYIGTVIIEKCKDIEAPIISAVTVPNDWVTAATVSILATDNFGVAEYAVSTASVAPTSGWQSSNSFVIRENGVHYAFARDSAGNVGKKQFSVKLDNVKPQITGVNIPTSWGQNAKITLAATDAMGEIWQYAVSESNAPPGTGWQLSPDFTLTKNDSYYAFVRDKAGNASAGFSFIVSKIDDIKPTISAVTVPNDWGKNAEISIKAADKETKIKEYAIGKNSTAPADGGEWQASEKFILAENGDFYAFAKDEAGNVSLGSKFTISKVDGLKPTISAVKALDAWGKDSKISITATDNLSGISDYAVSENSAVPTAEKWQLSPDFTLTKNGSYYAFVRDKAGNASAGFYFNVSKVDNIKPTVSGIKRTNAWGRDEKITLIANDNETGLKDFAISESSTAPTENWQTSKDFVVTKNADYYAFARDLVGNVSVGFRFSVTKIDVAAPTIESVVFSSDNATATVTAKDEGGGVEKITLDDVTKSGGYASFSVAGKKYIEVFATDKAGNLSEKKKLRVTGWFDELSTLTILPVEFSERNQVATVTAATTKTAIKHVSINGKDYPQNPITYRVGANERYLEIYAEDINGDRSPLYRVRIPGWSVELETISVTGCIFSDNNTKATVTATETAGVGISGLYCNGEFLSGSPAVFDIPKGTQHIKLQAENNDGDRSKVITRRVPSWSETTTSVTISNVEFVNYNTGAEVTATARAGSSVAGIYVVGFTSTI